MGMNIQHHPQLCQKTKSKIGFPDPGINHHQGTNLSARSNSSLQAPSEKAQASSHDNRGPVFEDLQLPNVLQQMCSASKSFLKFTKIFGKIASNGHRRPRRTRGDVGTSINPGHPMSPILKVKTYLKSDFLWFKIIFQNHISIYSDLNSLISI